MTPAPPLALYVGGHSHPLPDGTPNPEGGYHPIAQSVAEAMGLVEGEVVDREHPAWSRITAIYQTPFTPAYCVLIQDYGEEDRIGDG